jgi:hypothetical protein
MKTREVYSIRWHSGARVWVCPQLNRMSTSGKLAFVRRLAEHLRRRWRFAHVLCQLRVFGKNGRIQFERTYGRDPKRYPS